MRVTDADLPAQTYRRPASLVARLAGAAAVLAGSTIVARSGVPAWEREAFTTLHGLPDWMDTLLWLPMQAGSAWFPVVAAAGAWWAWRAWRPVAGTLVVGWGGWILAKAVKDAVGRGRPAVELPLDVQPGILTEGLGFVSGHSTVAFGVAAVLSPYLTRPWRVALYGLAVTVALARLVTGAHLPLDVVGGASLGLALGYGWNLLVGVPRAPVRSRHVAVAP